MPRRVTVPEELLPFSPHAQFDPLPSVWPTNYARNVGEINSLSPIPFIWAYGARGAGKSTLASMIHPAAPGERATTLYFDLEMGNTSRANQMAMQYCDLISLAAQMFPDGYRPIQIFEIWWSIISQLPPGLFSITVIDPISELEEGLKEYVETNYSDFKRGPGEYTKNRSAFWDDVKTLLKTILTDVATRVQTVVGISHLRVAWEGNRPSPSGRMEPKGLKVWEELASIALWLDRIPNQRAPRARVDKCRIDRLNWSKQDEFGTPEILPMLPPTMPVCDIPTIKRMMATPVTSFSQEEMTELDLAEARLSDGQRMVLEAEIAAGRRAELEVSAKQEILNHLLSQKYYQNATQVGEAVTKLGLVFSLETRDIFQNTLIEYAQV